VYPSILASGKSQIRLGLGGSAKKVQAFAMLVIWLWGSCERSYKRGEGDFGGSVELGAYISVVRAIVDT
jgi:hypothetical protein